jgi:hypothetical protein
MIIVYLVAGAPVMQVVVAILTTWPPAVVLAVVLASTRSLTLTMQVSALLAAIAILGCYAFIADLTAFWQPVMALMADWANASALYDQAQLIADEPALVAQLLTVSLVVSSWTMYTLYLLFGYRYAEAAPGESGRYGRFCDLNFGRVIALMVGIVSLLAFATGMAWMQSLAIVLCAVFWLQGLAVVHWMFVDGELPLFVVIMVYVLLPFLHVFLIMALAVVGYTDTWFRYRRRVVAANEE